MVAEITPRDFLARRERGDALLLVDVREDWEIKLAPVPSAVLHMPMGNIPERLAELDAKAEVVIICRSGGRSLQVARFLEQHGFERVANLTGGILAWSRDIDPGIPAY
jgi:rhodanese-related sulfurtransferase